jgi:hypothetical protein
VTFLQNICQNFTCAIVSGAGPMANQNYAVSFTTQKWWFYYYFSPSTNYLVLKNYFIQYCVHYTYCTPTYNRIKGGYIRISHLQFGETPTLATCEDDMCVLRGMMRESVKLDCNVMLCAGAASFHLVVSAVMTSVPDGLDSPVDSTIDQCSILPIINTKLSPCLQFYSSRASSRRRANVTTYQIIVLNHERFWY